MGGSGFAANVIEGEPNLHVGRLALVNQAIKQGQLVFIARERLEIGAAHEVPALLDDKRTVHHEESLLGHDGVVAFAGGEVGIGKIEREKHVWQVGAIDITVNGAPGGVRLGVKPYRGTVHGGVE